MLEASTALSSPQQSFYRQRFTSLCVLLLACSFVLCIPPHEAASNPATLPASIECTTVLHTDILKAVTVHCTTARHTANGILKAAGVQTLYNNLCQPLGHACPNQHELMLLPT